MMMAVRIILNLCMTCMSLLTAVSFIDSSAMAESDEIGPLLFFEKPGEDNTVLSYMDPRLELVRNEPKVNKEEQST